MTKVKICLIGATGVGKTSLTSRYVHSSFSESYLTTIGVKIETRKTRRADYELQLVIWDMSGEDEFQTVQASYLMGASGYLLVIDGTRRGTAQTARGLAQRVRDAAGGIPFVLVINKADLAASWEVEQVDTEPLDRKAYARVETSARTGAGVGKAFDLLVDAILKERPLGAE
jgi:small GTP-binding protein